MSLTLNPAKLSSCCHIIKKTLLIVIMSNVLGHIGLLHPFGGFLFFIVGYQETIHFAKETDKFKGCDTIGLVLELANHLRISLAMEKMVSRVVGSVVSIQVFKHILVKIISSNMVCQTISVSKQQLGPLTIHRQDMVVVEVIHMQFRKVKNTHSNINWFVQNNVRLCKFYNSNIFIDDVEALEGLTCDEFLGSFFICNDSDIKMTTIILESFSIDGIVHQFE